MTIPPPNLTPTPPVPKTEGLRSRANEPAHESFDASLRNAGDGDADRPHAAELKQDESLPVTPAKGSDRHVAVNAEQQNSNDDADEKSEAAEAQPVVAAGQAPPAARDQPASSGDAQQSTGDAQIIALGSAGTALQNLIAFTTVQVPAGATTVETGADGNRGTSPHAPAGTMAHPSRDSGEPAPAVRTIAPVESPPSSRSEPMAHPPSQDASSDVEGNHVVARSSKPIADPAPLLGRFASTAVEPADPHRDATNPTNVNSSPKHAAPDQLRAAMTNSAAPAVPAAVARAAEVDASVRVEMATGSGPTVHVDAATSATKTIQAAMTTGSGDVGNDGAGRDNLRMEQPQFTGRVLRGLTAMLNQRGGVMNMRLDPPHLGTLRIQMTIMRGVVTAEFHASTSAAQQMLDQSLATLRTALEGQGLTVERLHVSSAAMHPQHTGADGQQQQAHTDAGDGQSRGRGDGHPHQQFGRDTNALFDAIFDELNHGRGGAQSQPLAGAST